MTITRRSGTEQKSRRTRNQIKYVQASNFEVRHNASWFYMYIQNSGWSKEQKETESLSEDEHVNNDFFSLGCVGRTLGKRPYYVVLCKDVIFGMKVLSLL